MTAGASRDGGSVPRSAGIPTAPRSGGDGDADVLLLRSADSIIVSASPARLPLYHSGSGTFVASNFAVGTGTPVVAAARGDFNADGVPDVVLSTYWPNPVDESLFGGPGGLGPALTTPRTEPADRYDAIDWNADGRDEVFRHTSVAVDVHSVGGGPAPLQPRGHHDPRSLMGARPRVSRGA